MTIDARVAIGDVRVDAADDVTVEVRSDIDDGTLRVAGSGAAGAVVRIGPEGEPDVSSTPGSVAATSWSASTRASVAEIRRAGDAARPAADRRRPAHPGRRIRRRRPTTAGSCSPTGPRSSTPPTRSSSARRAGRAAAGVTIVPTPVGDFQLLPRSLLITPIGEVLDLAGDPGRPRPADRTDDDAPAATTADRRADHDRHQEDDHARHPVDTLSAALGVVTVGAGVLVMTDAFDGIDSDGGWWFAVGALVVGIGLIPWSRALATEPSAGRRARRSRRSRGDRRSLGWPPHAPHRPRRAAPPPRRPPPPGARRPAASSRSPATSSACTRRTRRPSCCRCGPASTRSPSPTSRTPCTSGARCCASWRCGGRCSSCRSTWRR